MTVELFVAFCCESLLYIKPISAPADEATNSSVFI